VLRTISNRICTSVVVTAVLLFVFGMQAYAEDYFHLRKPVQHYINIHLAGGGVASFLNDVTPPPYTSECPKVIGGIGESAALGLSYEIRYHRFFVNIGAEFDGDIQHFFMDAFTDTIHNTWVPARDHDRQVAQPSTYMYQYTNYNESDYELRWAVPVQFGYLFNSYFYGAIGLKYSRSIMNYYTATTDMRTTMMLNNAFDFNGEPIKVEAKSNIAGLYGVFPQDSYDFDSKTQNNSYAKLDMLSPTLEIGGRIPIAYRTVLRVGAYLEYGIPLGWKPDPDKKHVNYDPIWGTADENGNRVGGIWQNFAYERKVEDLQLISVNPIKNSDWTMKGYSTISFGVRVTLSFNITPSKHWCNCDKDLNLRPRRGGGRIDK